MTLKRFALYGAAILTALTLASCGGDGESTPTSSVRDIQAENDRYETSLIPRLERTGSTVAIEDAQDICNYVDQGKTEDQIIEEVEPYSESGYRKVIRYTAQLMCDSENSRNFEAPSAAEETIVPFEQRSPEEQQRGLEELADLLGDSSDGEFSDGTHAVGSDIDPGTYRRTGTGSCYWARLSGFGGTVDDIIANDNTNGQAYVTIDPTDTAFESKRCGTWELVE